MYKNPFAYRTWSQARRDASRKYAADATEKPCTRCEVIKPLSDYDALTAGALGRNPRCQQCRRETAKAHTKRQREAQATRPRPDACECCSGAPGTRALHWDHDHTTGLFRGWLCSGCNSALGQLGDDLARLELLASYLRMAGRT